MIKWIKIVPAVVGFVACGQRVEDRRCTTLRPETVTVTKEVITKPEIVEVVKEVVVTQAEIVEKEVPVITEKLVEVELPLSYHARQCNKDVIKYGESLYLLDSRLVLLTEEWYEINDRCSMRNFNGILEVNESRPR